MVKIPEGRTLHLKTEVFKAMSMRELFKGCTSHITTKDDGRLLYLPSRVYVMLMIRNPNYLKQCYINMHEYRDGSVRDIYNQDTVVLVDGRVKCKYRHATVERTVHQPINPQSIERLYETLHKTQRVSGEHETKQTD